MRLKATGVSHRFGDLEVLHEIDLEVAEGEVLGVVGPSGCGKSTLLGLLGGLSEVTRGEVSISGPVPDGCLNALTYVFQDFSLLPWRTVAGNVSLPLEGVLKASEISERVAEVLARTELSSFAAAYPRQLSGGMCQRVGIARALAVRPAVLLMDEPLSALDAQTRTILQEDLVGLWETESCATVYVTHNLAEAVALCDRVVVLAERPARVVEVVEIPLERRERRRGDPTLVALEDRLWKLLRRDAVAAAATLDHSAVVPRDRAVGRLL